MSLNQSRAKKSEPPLNRTSGRSGSYGLQRNFSGRKGGGGGTAPQPASSSTNSSLSSNRKFSFKKSSNAQGEQTRVSSWNVSSDSNNAAGLAAQNGAHMQQPVYGASDAQVTGVTVKPTDMLTQKNTRGVPKSPSSNSSNVTSVTVAPATPTKTSGDPSRAFPLQFGSISPGFMNGTQMPARTNSAPPNLDEQKHDQARHETLRTAPTVRAPAIPKQQLPTKDFGAVDQSNSADVHPMSKTKRDVQVIVGPPSTQIQKPYTHTISGIPMHIPFHQAQIPVQFGGPNSQMQSQGLTNTSLPMPMPLPMGNPSQVQQQIFVPGLQPHLMQSQGIMHQGPSMNFSSQMGTQLPPQLGNMGISISSQFAQQQAGKFGGPRKTVKITHPDTHEELRLDKRGDTYGDGGSSGPQSHPNMPPQSQPIPLFPPAHSVNYYHNSYNSSPLLFLAPSSLPLTSSQMTPSSQASRFYNQVTVKPAASLHEKAIESSPSTNSPVGEKEDPKAPRIPGEACSIHPRRDSENILESSLQQSKSTSVPEPSKPSVAVPDSVLAYTPTASSFPTENIKREVCDRSDLSKDELDKPGKKGNSLPENQVGGQLTSSSGLSQSSELGTLSNFGVGETVSVTKSPALSGTNGGVHDTSKEELATTGVAAADAFGPKTNNAGAGTTFVLTETIGSESLADSSQDNEKSKDETIRPNEKGEMLLAVDSIQDDRFKITQNTLSLNSSVFIDQTENTRVLEVTTRSSGAGSSETTQDKLVEPVVCHGEDEGADNVVTSTSIALDDLVSEASSLNLGLSKISHTDKISISDTALGSNEVVDSTKASIPDSGETDKKSPSVLIPSYAEDTSRGESEGAYNNNTGLLSPSSGLKDKPLLEPNKPKITMTRGKKRKEAIQKADRLGSTSDLYMAYKEKKETVPLGESTENSSSISSKQISAVLALEDSIQNESKAEPDDWEDAADISTPKLGTSDYMKQVQGGMKHNGEDGNLMAKKYSRDFLLKFSEQCIDLPEGFEITSDIAEALIVSNVLVSRESYPSPGRVIDRPIGGPRLDRRGSGMYDDDKWNKVPGLLASGRDLRLDIGYGNVGSFRLGQGGNYGALWNPRAQSPVLCSGGILSDPMQSISSQGGMQRNFSDSGRWQRASGFHKGLIPSPQTSLQVMHKAERKYEVGKISDVEQAKQRQLKGILNKLTPQNFEKLFEQVKQVNIDNAVTLTGIISQIFDKALMEPTFCEMYANFCYHLAGKLPDFNENNENITFKRLLLNKCQEEFERGEREQEEANRAEEEGEAKQSEEEREEKRIQARRRMLGNIRLIGELYKKKMLTERIMHECIKKLLGQYQNPDEEDVEALCKLMSTIGEMIDHPKAKEHMDAYFDMMAKLSNNMKLSSRVRFMLRDSIDLRKNKWQQRRKVEGPKKIEEVHRDAAQERQAQSSRLARGTSMNSSYRRGQPVDFTLRGVNSLSSPNAQMGGFRGYPQDIRSEEREPFENRTLSVPLPQRPVGDDSITLGPQGGLARGMSIRGQPAMPNITFSDMHYPESRRITGKLNGYSSIPERPAYTSREDQLSRYVPDRFVGPPAYEPMNAQDLNMSYTSRDIRNSDRSFDRCRPTSPQIRGLEPVLVENVSSGKVWPEERLRDMSMEAIKEFYSAKDEKEVALCVKELNAPSFYPSMISIWVTDSFERKDIERDLLAKLLVNLTKSREAMISHDQLLKGFESVLSTLEDAVNDAPKAAEFLGHIFAKVTLENVIPMTEIGRLIYEGGEEQGQLVEIGLAAEVLGSVLEIIKSEKGEPILSQVLAGSNLRLENFRPPNSKRSWRLDKFII